MFGWLGTVGDTVKAAHAAAPSGIGQVGLDGAVSVASPDGWRAASAVAPGDLLLTFDAGLQEVEAILSEPSWPGRGACPPALWPVEVAPGVLGNRELMYLAPDQPILIESDAAEMLTGDPFALVTARSLAGLPGIHRAPPRDGAESVTLTFASEQIVFAGGGAALHCPIAAPDLIDAGAPAARYPLLGGDKARQVVAQLALPGGQARSAGLPGINS